MKFKLKVAALDSRQHHNQALLYKLQIDEKNLQFGSK